MGANGNINDLELAKFIELAGQYGIRVHILHGDSWLPSVANLAALPSVGNTTGDIRQALDTGTPYRWNGSAWAVWSTSGTSWGSIAGTLADQTDLQAALDAKMGAGAYVLVSQDSLLANQINLGSLTSGILKQTVAAGISTISILTDNSGNWNIAYTHSQDTTTNPHNVTKTQVGLGNVDNTSDVNKPVSTAQAAADTAALNAAKAYADGLVVGLLDDRGNYNASVNTFPASGGSGTAGAILKGDLWTVSVAGTLGGVSVTPGDLVRAIVDTPGQTSTNWAIAETNIGFTPENSANKATTMTGNEASNTLYLTAKAVYDWATGLFVQKNGAITGATKTKITYDAKGLVIAGADATTADIADSADKRYVTDAEKTKLANTSNTNSGDETLASIGTKMFTATGKTTPVDADGFSIFDSAASNVLKTLTFTNLKVFLKTWIDSLTTTFTNKTIALGSNTVSGTKAQFNTANTDGDFMFLDSADTVSGVKTFLSGMMGLRNIANTFTSFFSNTATASRTWTLQDRNGILADDTDLALKANLASPTFTGTVTVPTPSNGTDAVNKTYADGLVTGLLDYRGGYDASVNTFPTSGGSGTAGAVLKGDMWVLSVAGTLGGTAVQIGDSLIANVDTPGQTAGNWNILNSNISYVPEDVANKSTSVTTDQASNTKYPSVKSVYDWATGLFATISNLALKAPIASPTFTGTVTLPTGLTGVLRADTGVVSTDTDVTDLVSAASTTAAGKVELATTAEINTGTDSTRAMPIDQYVASNRNVRYIDIYAIEKATDNAVGTNIAGSFECPFTGTITEIGAYVETAGVTGASIWDVNKNGTTIMTTNKLSIDSAEVSTRTAATAPTLTTTAITAGDIITIDTDSLSTTKPKGLHVRIGIRLT